MTEEYFKILHRPSGKFVKLYNMSNIINNLHKTGRLWTRFSDVLITYKTIKKNLTNKFLILDFEIIKYQLIAFETYSQSDLENEINKRNSVYEKKKLKEELSSTEYQLEILIKDLRNNSIDIPKLEKKIAELKLKLKK